MTVATAWSRIEPIVRNTAAIAAFLLLWELAPRLGWINRTFMPPFSEVILKGAAYAWAGKLLPQVWVSVQRALGGFALGVVVALYQGRSDASSRGGPVTDWSGPYVAATRARR